MIKSFNKRQRFLFIVCVLTGVFALGYSFIFKPLENKIISLEDEIGAQRIQLQKSRDIIEKAEGISGAYDAYLKDFKQDKTSDKVMASVLSEIEGVAGGLSLPISDLKPKRVKESELYNRFSVSLTIDSEFVNIMHFLHILQNEPHNFDVEEFQIDKGTRRQTATVKASLVLSKILIR